MKTNLDQILNDVKTFHEEQINFYKKFNELIESEEDNLSKKVYKNIKKLTYFIESEKEFIKDTIKSIEKSIDKEKD